MAKISLRQLRHAYIARPSQDSDWAVFRHIQLPKIKRVLTIAVLLRFMDS